MFYKFLDINKYVHEKNLDILEEIIYWSVITKLKRFQRLQRKVNKIDFNYGYTFGQAIEAYYGLYQEKLTQKQYH